MPVPEQRGEQLRKALWDKQFLLSFYKPLGCAREAVG